MALARALVMKPRVILFDEPLSNLDAKLRHHVHAEIRTLQQRLGPTTVNVTHDQEEAMAISDRVVVMNAGWIEQQGAPRDLLRCPVSHFVSGFIGSANILPGRYDGQTIEMGAARIRHAQEIAAGPVGVMVRPEAVRLARGGCPQVSCRSRSSAR